ncbi:MAG: beta-propeller domain-containing protein [Rectinemataceae bacterium]
MLSDSFHAGRATRKAAFALAAFLGLVVGSCALWPGSSRQATLLLKQDSRFYTPDGQGLRSDMATGTLDAALSSTIAATSEKSSSSPVEPDVFHIDAENHRLYLSNEYRGLLAIDITLPEKPILVGRVRVTGSPYELYESGSTILLLSNPSSTSYAMAMRGAPVATAVKSAVTFIEAGAIGSAAAATAARVEIGGSIVDSRLVGSSLIIATNEGWYSAVTPLSGRASAEPATADPASGSAPIGSSVSSSVASTSSPLGSGFQASLTVVNAATQAVTTLPIPGNCSAIHVAATGDGSAAVFVASMEAFWSSLTTTITRFDVDAAGTLTQSASVGVRGWISDRFKLDLKDGWLRVVADDSGDWAHRTTRVFAIDWRDPANPDSYEAAKGERFSGAIELAAGESLRASRFDGDMAYVVTFFTTDPLFTVSFADPAHPVNLGELKVPGYSTHIETFSGPADEKLLFAVGVAGASGNWRTKAAIYDVSDPSKPVQKGSDLLLGDGWSWSAATWDWKRINRLAELGSYSIPYYSYDYTAGTGGFSIALVKAEAAGPSLLCELPDSGDALRSIGVSPDIAYSYALDRLDAWRPAAGSAQLLSELPLAFDVAWTGLVSGKGIMVARNGSGLSVSSFEPDAYMEPVPIATIKLPASSDRNNYVWYPLGQNGIVALPDKGLLVILSQSWGSSGTGTAILHAIRVGTDGSLKVEPDAITRGLSYPDWISLGRNVPRLETLPDGRLLLFHGGLTLVDAALWTTAAPLIVSGCVEAMASGSELATFSWSRSEIDGYGSMTMDTWDIAAASPVSASKGTSFPGYPLARLPDGSWLSAYQPASWLDSSRILKVAANGSTAQVLGETPMDGVLSDWRPIASGVALLTGGGRYMNAYMYADAMVSSAAMRDVAIGGWWYGGERKLLFASAEGSAPVVTTVATLSGWNASMAKSEAGVTPERLAIATPASVLLYTPKAAGLEAKESWTPSGNLQNWYSPVVALCGGELWVAESWAGIERFTPAAR